MMKISEVVQKILYSSENALMAINEGYLNLSAYAKIIQKQVEEKSKKPVKTGSIVVALSRLAKVVKNKRSILPSIKIEEMTIKSPLVVITYEKNRENLARLKDFYQKINLHAGDFFVLTQGTVEITIICNETAQSFIIESFPQIPPKTVIRNLAGISIRFSEQYVDEPNIIFALLRILAIRQINIIEIVSTYTELTFIIREQDLDVSFSYLQKMMKNRDFQ